METPIRVAQIIGRLCAGGIEAVVFNYYRNIDHEKIQFDFFYDTGSIVEPPEDLIKMGANFYMLPPYQNLSIYIRELRKYLIQNKYQIVHSHVNTLSIFPLYAAWCENIPVRIAHNHSVPGGNELKRNILKRLLRYGSRLFSTDYFACSEKAGRWLFGNRVFDNGKVVVIKNAIDYEKYHFDLNNKEKIKRDLGIRDKVVIGHVGRFTFAKNHDLLIDIFARFHEEHKDSILMLVGDGELREKIEEKLNKLQLTEECILIGKTSNSEKYYQAMDVLVMPSVFEGLGLAAVEAQACKVPVIVSKAISEEAIISDAVNYVNLNDQLEVWIEKIENVIGKEVHFVEQYGAYDIKKAVHILMKWYLQRGRM